MATPREVFCDYFDGAPLLLRLNVSLLAILLLTLPFLTPGSASYTIALFAIVPLTVSILGLWLCNRYCDWGRITAEMDEESE